MSIRWYVKKVARSGLALGAFGAVGVLAGKNAPSVPRVRALTYHRFGIEPREAFCLDPMDFEEQVQWLASEGLAVSLDDVIEFARGRRELRDGSALITIDDGCVSTFEVAVPILERWKVPSVAFVSSGLVGAGRRGAPERYLTWDELRACAATRMEIASHPYSHRSLGRMPVDEAWAEARRSREQLEAELGRPVRAFAYPFGTRGDFDERTHAGVRDAGYEAAFHSQHGAIRPGCDLFALPRVKVEGGEALWMFKLVVQGAMDSWRVVDENLWRLQRDRREISVE